MTIYDISLPISESTLVWPGDPPIRLPKPAHLDRGDLCTITRLDMSAHTGTHIDAPAHFLRGGATVDALDLNILVGPALVVDARHVDALSATALYTLAIPAGVERLLIRTRNSELWNHPKQGFREDFVGITEDGARWLVAQGIRLVGIDYLSVAPFDQPAPTHEILLNAGVIPIEGLDLRQIRPGLYQLVCLPLNIVGSDGAPARVILID